MLYIYSIYSIFTGVYSYLSPWSGELFYCHLIMILLFYFKKTDNSFQVKKCIWITERLCKSSGLKPATLASYPDFTSYDLYIGVCWEMFNNQLWSKNRPWYMGFTNFHVVFSNLLWLILSYRPEVGKLELGSNMYSWLSPACVSLTHDP